MYFEFKHPCCKCVVQSNVQTRSVQLYSVLVQLRRAGAGRAAAAQRLELLELGQVLRESSLQSQPAQSELSVRPAQAHKYCLCAEASSGMLVTFPLKYLQVNI